MIKANIFQNSVIIRMENCIFDSHSIETLLSPCELDNVEEINIVDYRTPTAIRSKYFNNKINENIDKLINRYKDKKIVVHSTHYQSKNTAIKVTNEPITVKSDYGWIHAVVIGAHLFLIETDSIDFPTNQQVYYSIQE